MKKLLIEQISREEMKKHIKDYYKYAKKFLRLTEKPILKLVDDEKNADDFLGKTGYYDPKKKTIVLYTKNRHPKDIVRSFAHEIIHHYQNLNEKLPDKILARTKEVGYASKDSHLRDMEREAFEKGNMMFRDWTDSLKQKRGKTMSESKLSKTKQRKQEEQVSIESVDPRFEKMFETEERVMDDYKTQREEIVYNELMKRFLGK